MTFKMFVETFPHIFFSSDFKALNVRYSAQILARISGPCSVISMPGLDQDTNAECLVSGLDLGPNIRSMPKYIDPWSRLCYKTKHLNG